ncbi:MAG: AAA family ATPase [Bacteroidaceae bacterium]|nr:AAA family ATPase [Bacteroidaceae bacterium]
MCYLRSMNNSILELQKLQTLLHMEHDFEREQFMEQSDKMSVQRKIKRGICWWPVRTGRSFYNSLNQLTIEIYRTEDDEIESVFEFGKTVNFFTITDKGTEYFKFTSTVSYVDDDRMVAVIPDSGAVLTLENAQNVGVQLYFDESTYRLMFEALNKVMQAKSGRLADLREIFHGNRKAEHLAFAPIRFPWLNAAQEQAVNEVLRAKDVAIVHGPPGTGKTTTLVEAIYETLRRESQVLVCAQSNMAVDWISEKLVDHGISVLRIGNPTRVNDKMLSFTYERKFESHPDYPQLWAARKAIRELYAQKKKGDSTHQKIARLKERATELEIRINEHLFADAKVIASTLTSTAHRVLTGRKFSTLFIDEAAQALEPACWIAIRKAGRVIFAGDHQQLPPTVKCYEAEKQGLSHTLMEQIVARRPETVTMLTTQYRMNEEIMRFSSNWFYQGKVESAKEVKFRSILDLDRPMMWIDTSSLPEDEYREQFVGESFGRINKAEAQLTLQTLKDYFNKIGKQRVLDERLDVGVISPYKVQVQYMRQLVRKDADLKPYRHLITLNTVDGFQGQERDIILISLVRANDDGQIGFLRDLRRMNVAMTRARMKLIILGNAATLSHHPFYKKLHEYIQNL